MPSLSVISGEWPLGNKASGEEKLGLNEEAEDNTREKVEDDTSEKDEDDTSEKA